jgi:putative transposase
MGSPALARVHERIRDARTTWLHQRSAEIAARFEIVAVEDLRLRNMTRSARGTSAEPGTNVRQKAGLNRSMLDASIGRFIDMLRYKTERASGEVRRVDARNTSQDCSGCGTRVPKPLRQRIHRCEGCGLVLHRDHNAARNILASAVPGLGDVSVIRQTAPGAELHAARGEDVRRPGTAPADLGPRA